MNQEPDFNAYISAGQREAAAQEAAQEAARLAQHAEKLRAQAEVLDVLNHVVLPLLTAALAQLSAKKFTADVANGQDAYGCLRRSLRISRPELSHSPMLVFTAETSSPKPFLGFHTETLPKPGGHMPAQLLDTSEAHITRIIGEFIQQSFL